MRYGEGDWFAVPLRSAGFATGLIARGSDRTRVLFGYFFGPRHQRRATLDDVTPYVPGDAVLAVRFGDARLADGTWPLIGTDPHFDRLAWPMPQFHAEAQNLVVTYADDDPAVEAALAEAVSHDLPQDTLLGADIVRDRVEALLDGLDEPTSEVLHRGN